jgi:hypothetical protein
VIEKLTDKDTAEKAVLSVGKQIAGKASEQVFLKLKGDPTKKAFKRALALAIKRYATGERMYLAKPLLDKHGILADPNVVKELACILGFEREPSAVTIGDYWKAAMPDAQTGVDFTKEAQLLLSFFNHALRETDVFRPVFDAKTLDVIASGTTISNQTLRDIEQGLANLAELINSSFGSLTRTFAEAIPRLRGQIIDFTTFIEDRTEAFVGREFVFDAFDNFTRKEPKGYFFVLGDPGIGKSALSAQMVKKRGCLHHFNIRAQGINTPLSFLRNISAQLIAAYGLSHSEIICDDAQFLQNSGFLDKILLEVASRLQGNKTFVVLDGLDEVDNHGLGSGANPLGLPIILPSGIYIFVTMRKDTVKPRIDSPCEWFTIQHDSDYNFADIRAYLQQALRTQGIKAYIVSKGLTESTFLEQLVSKSEGNFMYLRYVLPEIERGLYKSSALEDLPSGLRNYYEDHWRKIRSRNSEQWFTYELPIVMALTVVKKPVSIDLISEFSGVRDRSRIRSVLLEWGQFLHQDFADIHNQPKERYRIYHESFLDFIAEKEEVKEERVSRGEANRKIADVLRRGLYGDE